LKTNLVLYFIFFKCCHNFFNLIYVMVNWFFAKNMLSSFDCFYGNLAVCVCR